MGRRSLKKMRKVRIRRQVRTAAAVFTRLGIRPPADDPPVPTGLWEIVDEKTGTVGAEFPSLDAAKSFCLKRDLDFGQFGA